MRFRTAYLILLLFMIVSMFSSAYAGETIDPATAQKDSLYWYDIKALGVEGKGWTDTKIFYDRLPAKAEGVVRTPVWNLSRDSAGLCVRFVTDATIIHARWDLRKESLAMNHMAATGVSGLDLYVRGTDSKWKWMAVGRPTKFPVNSAILVSGIPEGTREYLLYLPLYNGVTAVEIGIPEGSSLMTAPPYPDKRKPILFYGTSITQGGCASRTGMVHTALLGRWLDYPVINLGFSGNGRMEPEMADLIAETDPSVFVLDCLPNMNGDMIKERLENFVQTLRKKHKSTPILFVEDRNYGNAILLPSRKASNDRNRAELRQAYYRLRESGVKNLYYLPGNRLLDDDEDNYGTVDGSHPTDLGFMRQAKAMKPILEKILGIEKTTMDKEWLRTDPDVIVYLPRGVNDGDNEHFQVFKAPKSEELLAIWTQSSVEGRGDNRAVIARSMDGVIWSDPVTIKGKGPGRDEGQASWAFPVVAKTGRIYCFYTKELDKIDARQSSGVMGTMFSDDNGHSWQDGADIPVPKTKFDNQDPGTPPNWIVWQQPIRDAKGRWIVGYTRTSSETAVKKPGKNWPDQDSRSAFIRFDNLDQGPAPKDLKLSWLPTDKEGLEVPHKVYPKISVSQEPAVVLLPDGRLFTVMRTMTGAIWYSVSDNDGETWREPEVLRYKDGGDEVKNPIAPCPIYRLENGRYILVFNNNGGKKGKYNQFAKNWKTNQLNHLRNPAFIAVGEFRKDAHQPLWFSKPKEILDTDGVVFGPKGTASVAMYPSLTELDGKRVLWYPDRKHFLLGLEITDDMLKGMSVDK